MAYERLVVSIKTPIGTSIYVPALHSSTKLIGAWFLLVQLMQQENSHDYVNAVSSHNAASNIDTIKGQHNSKSYC